MWLGHRKVITGTVLHSDTTQQSLLMLNCGLDIAKPVLLQLSVHMDAESDAISRKGLEGVGHDVLKSQNGAFNVQVSLQDSEVPQFRSVFNSCSAARFEFARCDMLIEVTSSGTPIRAWSDQLLDSLPLTPLSTSCFSRPLQTTQGHCKEFVVVSITKTLSLLRLKPSFDTIRLLGIGASPQKSPISVSDPPPSTRAIHAHEKVLAFIFGQIGITGENCRNIPVNVRGTPNTTAVTTKVFCHNMDEVRFSNFIKEFSGLEFFAAMPLAVYEGDSFVECELVLEVFYKKNAQHRTCSQDLGLPM